jgi:hypothetical protein
MNKVPEAFADVQVDMWNLPLFVAHISHQSVPVCIVCLEEADASFEVVV